MISESSIRASRIALPGTYFVADMRPAVASGDTEIGEQKRHGLGAYRGAAFGLLARAYPNEVPDELKNEIDVCTKLMDDIGSEHACSGFLDR
jgi:hypothetical protein